MANYNNNKEKKTVNTSGPSFYNSNGYEATGINIGYWSGMLKLDFIPALPEGQQTVDKKFDTRNGISASLTPSKAHALYTGVEEKIIPAIKEGRDAKVGVIIADTNLVIVSSGADRLDVDGQLRPYISLYKDLNASTRIAQTQISYEFGSTEIIEGYNAETGDFEATSRLNNEITMIMNILGDYYKATSNMFTHTDRVVNNTYKTKVTDNQTKIGEKLGLDLGYKPNNYSNGTQGSIFDKKNQGGAPQVDEETLSSLDDLDL